MSQHIVPIKIYLAVFVVLLAFTGLTIQVAFINLGPLNTILALSIALFKGSLVVLYFMHVRYGSHLIKLFAVAGLVWLVILLALTVSDYLTRGWMPAPEGWSGRAPSRHSIVAGFLVSQGYNRSCCCRFAAIGGREPLSPHPPPQSENRLATPSA